MKKILALLFCLSSVLAGRSQKITDLITHDTIVYVYKLDFEQSKFILQQKKIVDTPFLFTRKFKEYPKRTYKPDTLPSGNYLIATITDNTVNYISEVRTPFVVANKVLNEDIVLFFRDKANGKTIKNIQVYLGTAPILFDAGTGGFTFSKKQFQEETKRSKEVTLKISYEAESYAFRLNLTDNPEQASNTNYYDGISGDISSPGYLILDKPKYKPLDTLHAKAYLVNFMNGKPIRRRMALSISDPTQNFLYQTKIKKRSPGAYTFQWPIPDTLKLDRMFQVELRYEKCHRRLYKQTQFKLEEYELAKNVFDAELKEATCYSGDDVVFYVTARDMNGFPVQGTQVHYSVRLINLMNLLTDTLQLSLDKRNTILSGDTVLEYESLTELRIPSAALLKANAVYNLEVTFTDPVSFERKSIIRTFTKYAQTEKLLFYQAEDSVHVRTLRNGKDTNRKYTFILLQNTDTLFLKKVTSPFHYQVDPFATQCVLIDADSNKRVLALQYNKLAIMHLKGKRTGDSIIVSFQYPFQENVHYRLFKKDKLVQSGESRNIRIAIPDKSADEYRLQVTHNLQQQIQYNFHEYTFVPEKNILHAETNIPKQALPGDSLAIDVVVKDYKNRPKRKINVAAYAQNKAFEQDLMVPVIDLPDQYRNQVTDKPLADRGTLFISAAAHGGTSTLKPHHFVRYNLRKNEYYAIKYPIQDKEIISVKKQQATPEFVLLITHQSVTYKPKYILVDGEPIYISDINQNEGYSLAVSPGNHTVSFRYFNKLYTIPAHDFKANTKYFFGVNYDSIPKYHSVQASDSLPVFEPTAEEKDILYSTLLLSNTFPYDTLRVITPDVNRKRVYYRSGVPVLNIDGNTYYVQGPFRKKEYLTLQRNDKTYTVAPGVESVYHYDEVQRTLTPKPLGKIQGAFLSFQETPFAWSQITYLLQPDTAKPQPVAAAVEYKPNVNEALRKKEADEENLFQNYRSPLGADAFQLWIENNNDTCFIKSIWFVSKRKFEASDFIQQIPKQVYSISKAASDNEFDVYIFFNKNRMAVLPNFSGKVQDILYLNPVNMKKVPFSKDNILIPLKIYSELNSVPLLPFYDEPLEAPEKLVRQSNDRNNSKVSGMITDRNQTPLAQALVYAEMNGVFKYGGVTNGNGLFEILDLIPGTYQFKVYHPEYKISHLKPQQVESGTGYELNATLVERATSAPIFETIQNDFRLLAFAEHPKENYLRITVHEKDSRMMLTDYRIQLYQNNVLIQTIPSSGNFTDLLFPTSELLEYRIEIVKPNYTTLRLNQIYFKSNYHYRLEAYMGLEKKEILKTKEFNLAMHAVQYRHKEYATTSPYVSLKDKGVAEQGEIYGQVVDENNQPLDFVSLSVKQAGVTRGGAKTDMYGNFRIKPLDAGTYSLNATYIGYQTTQITEIVVQKNHRIEIKITLIKSSSKELKSVVVKAERKLVSNQEFDMNVEESVRVQNAPSYNYSASAPMNASIVMDAGSATYVIDGIQVAGDRATYFQSYNSELNEKQISRVSNGVMDKEKIYADSDLINRAVENKNVSTLRKWFKDVGYWKPNLVTNKQGRASFTVKLPDNITTWKSFLVMMGKRWMHGVDSSDIAVYKPLQTLVTAPNYLYQFDSLFAKVKYQNLTAKPLRIQTIGKLNATAQYDKLITLENTALDSVLIQARTLDSLVLEAGMIFEKRYKDFEQYTLPVFSPALTFYANQSIRMEESMTYPLQFEKNTEGEIIFNNTLLEKILESTKEVVNYEYGCVEQTASKLNALLLRNKILTQLKQPGTSSSGIKKLLAQLSDMQNTDGSFGWWKRNGVQHRMTIYVMEMAYKALQDGHLNNVYESAAQYIRNHYESMSTSDQLYAYAVLLQSKGANENMSNIYSKCNWQNLTTLDKFYYFHCKQLRKEETNAEDLYSIFLELNRSMGAAYQDNFFYDNRAMLYKAYSLFRGTPYEKEFLRVFRKRLESGQLESGLNTHAKVAMIEAMLLLDQNDSTQRISSVLTVNDSLKITTFPKRIPIQGTTYRIHHEGGPVFLNTSEKRSMLNPEVRDSLFSIRRYFKQNGSNQSSITMGKDVELVIDIQAYKKGDYVMVEIPIPSGMKVKNKQTQFSSGNYIEYRKEKVMYYFEQLPMGTHQLKIQLMPVFRGQYTLPPAKASLMYYPYQYGNTTQDRIQIK